MILVVFSVSLTHTQNFKLKDFFHINQIKCHQNTLSHCKDPSYDDVSEKLLNSRSELGTQFEQTGCFCTSLKRQVID
jgi:hypothetical protein